MPALASRDAERLLRFVAEAESIGGDRPFTGDLLVELGRLVPADFLDYYEGDSVRRRELSSIVHPGDEWEFGESDSATIREIIFEDGPICRRHQEGYFGALKLSDFFSRSQLHRTRLYDFCWRPWGLEWGLVVGIPSPLWHLKSLAFYRAGSRDFSERDRLVLDFLQPHLARLQRAGRTRRLLKAALAELDRAGEHDRRGVILLGLSGEVDFASHAAERLLREFFPGTSDDRLPAALAEWFDAERRAAVVRRRGARRLR